MSISTDEPDDFIIHIANITAATERRRAPVEWAEAGCKFNKNCYNDVMNILESKPSLENIDPNYTFYVYTTYKDSGLKASSFRIDTETCDTVVNTMKKHGFELKVKLWDYEKRLPYHLRIKQY